MIGLRLRHISLAVVGLMFITGAAVLGAGALSLLDRNASQPAAVRGLEPTAYPSPTPTPTPPPLAREVPSRIIIDTIGVDAPIATFGLDEDGLPQVPLNGTQVAWYNFTSKPGAGGNAVFAGHINWQRAPAVFADLKELGASDVIRLVTSEGNLVYEVTDSFLVDPADPASVKVMAPTESDVITLISCGGTWVPDPSELFGGKYTNRVIVRAALVGQPVGVPSTVGF